MGRLSKNLIGVSVKECARQLSVSDTAIHKAIKAERVQKNPDGSVNVEEVRKGMSMTADPFRGGQREAGVFGELPFETTVSSGAAHSADAAAPTPAAEKRSAHAPLLAARTISEQTRAEREQIELAKMKGTVAEIAPMTRAVHDAMVACRTELQALADRLTPIVTPETDGQRVHTAIEAEVTRICETLRGKLAHMAAAHEAVLA